MALTSSVPQKKVGRRTVGLWLLASFFGLSGNGLTGAGNRAVAAMSSKHVRWIATVANAIVGDLPYRQVGQAYLEVRPFECEQGVLMPLVFAGDPQVADRLPVAKRLKWLKQGLRLRSSEDYREGRIVVCEGWVLSVTEARLCALAGICER